MTQQQFQDANTQIQKNINALETFGNNIQWALSNYNGTVTGTQTMSETNPEQTPYESHSHEVGRVNANIVKQNYGNESMPATSIDGQTCTVPQGSHYVSSNITNTGKESNTLTLAFYK